jgi:organic radical activating enzyme
MYPWIHLHAWPTGQAFPCCHAEMGVGQVGNCRTEPMKQIWNSTAQRKLRQDMLTETPNAACGRCYEQEKSGFFSGRQSSNKHHGHNVDRVQNTTPDGYLEQFELTYWDVRFSNLCNLKCRSCGHIFSSQWYQDQAKLAGGNWKERNTVLNYAGRTETDMWEQMEPHIPYLEQIYFAGGEPLIMEEHYRILKELVKREMFGVRLQYNTNFSRLNLKKENVLDYWKLFKSVSIGASLDAMGLRAEYIRKGTKWDQIVRNREQMLQVTPRTDFYVSSTVSIYNILHVMDFHKDWVERGLIKAQDWNINILQGPDRDRIDVLPAYYKDQVKEKINEHINWLSNRDPLKRATSGYKAILNFLDQEDNSHLLKDFFDWLSPAPVPDLISLMVFLVESNKLVT